MTFSEFLLSIESLLSTSGDKAVELANLLWTVACSMSITREGPAQTYIPREDNKLYMVRSRS